MAEQHPKLRAIGKALQDEESRFIGYSEIERKSKELGFGMSVRTIRFYVDEGILPPPKKVGKTPVYEEEWILNVLLSIHLMKTRLNRSLTEIRTILGQLQETPESLADKLSVLYEDYAKGGFLKPTERAALVDAFFDILSGRLGEPRQASAIRLAELVDAITTHGTWDGDEWTAPDPEKVLASQGMSAGSGKAEKPKVRVKLKGFAEEVERDARPKLEVDEPSDGETSTRDDEDAVDLSNDDVHPELGVMSEAPEAATTARIARSREQTFVQRFKSNFERLGRVHCPVDGKGYKAGLRERSFLKRDRSTDVIELMKRNRIYDRSLLDVLPLGETWEFQVFQRGLFGRGDLKVVVTGLALSPFERLVKQRWAEEPLGPLAAKRALDELDQRSDVFHYVGLLSTVGWSESAVQQIPTRRNLLACLIENVGGSAWRTHLVPDERWGAVGRVFDPETDQEKIDRAREYMEEHLRPKGEFLIVRNLPEDLDVPTTVVQTAMDEPLARDDELSVVSAGGREIIKRTRL